MKVIAAYLLAVMGGNKDPTAEDIKDILGSVGAADDTDDRIQLLFSQVKGKDLTELIARGREKFAVSGGGAPMEANATGIGAVAEQKKEEKVEEQIDEFTDSDDDGSVVFSFFNDYSDIE